MCSVTQKKEKNQTNIPKYAKNRTTSREMFCAEPFSNVMTSEFPTQNWLLLGREKIAYKSSARMSIIYFYETVQFYSNVAFSVISFVTLLLLQGCCHGNSVFFLAKRQQI
jgi:hypothetical protein